MSSSITSRRAKALTGTMVLVFVFIFIVNVVLIFDIFRVEKMQAFQDGLFVSGPSFGPHC